MPLPDAEPPEESRLYEELKSKNALGGATGGNTADLMDALRLATFLDAENEDQLRRLLLIGLASGTFSVTGPIPGTSKVLKVDTTSSGTRVTAFQPNPGEVWQMFGAVSTSATGLSGTVYIEVLIQERATGNKSEIISTSTTTGTLLPATEITHNPIFIDENTEILCEATGTFTLLDFAIPLIRVR